MAETGEPKEPATSPDASGRDHDPDAHVGFVSPASLAGRPRTLEAEPQPLPASEPVASAARDLFDPPEPEPVRPAAAAARLEPDPSEASLRSRPVDALRQSLGNADDRPAAPMSLYAVYVLILLAVPTLGLAAILALLAVTGRDGPSDPLAAGHFVYQQRTLWTGAVAVVLGGLLVIVNIGVFVLFLAALWVLARGVFGVLRLKAGRPIRDPRSWLF